MPSPRGSGFIGLGQYLQANQQAAQQMGNALAQGIEQQGADAKGSIDQAGQLFDTRATQGTPTEASLSTDIMLEPGIVGDAARQGRIGYTGPKQLSDVANVDALSAQAQTAGDRARLGATDAGLAVLMGQQGGANTQGGRVLDSFLARRGAGERLDKAASAYGRLGSYLGAAQDKATARGKQGESDAAALSSKLGAQYPASPATPARVTPAATAATSATATNPRVKNAKQIEDENRLKSKYGYRG